MQEAPGGSDQQQRVLQLAMALLLASVLLAIAFRVLLPFVGVLTYAVIIATATAGPFDRLADLLGKRRRLASVLFGVIAATVAIVPLIYLSSSVVHLVGDAGAWLNAAGSRGFPDLPAWIAGLPLLGEKISTLWQELQRDGVVALKQHQPQLAAAGRWLLGLSADLVVAMFEILLGVIVAAMIHASRAQVLRYTYGVFEHVAGPRGALVLDAASKAIKGVAIGVIGTAFLEGVLAWIGFFLAGVPSAVALAAATFFFALIQLGPIPVFLPVALWLAYSGQTLWAIFIAAWGVVLLMGTDTFVKPVLIARSGHLPVLLLFVGVIGGLAAWGFTGMFIGAMALAILWTIVQVWIGVSMNATKKAAPDK